MNGPTASQQLLMRAPRFNPSEIKKALGEPEGFNVTLMITRSVGTMACAYSFALISLADAIKAGRPASCLLSIIMVGQTVQPAASDARAEKGFADAFTR